MSRRTLAPYLLPGLILAAVGCQQPKIDVNEMLKPPPRPAELDVLNPLVGAWEAKGEFRMAGVEKPVQCTMKSTVAWDLERWMLTERTEGTLGESGRMVGLGVWYWDAAEKKFRNSWFDNYGMYGEGWATWDAGTKTFTSKATSKNPGTGATSYGHGTLRIVDDTTIEWSWKETDLWGLTTYMEMKGVSHKK